MGDESNKKQIPYGQALRVIGRQLDAQVIRRIILEEESGGFNVQLDPTHDAAGRPTRFTWDYLQSVFILQAVNRQLGPPSTLHPASPHLPGSWEDVLRTVGAELDGERAMQIRIELISDDMMVTYLRSGVSNPADAPLRRRVYQGADLDRLLERAKDRRRELQEGRRASAPEGPEDDATVL